MQAEQFGADCGADDFALPAVKIKWSDESTDFYFEKQIGNYRVLSRLGSGQFGMVKSAEDVVNHVQVAIKLVNKSDLNELELQSIKTEAEVMSYLKHRNVVGLLEVIENRSYICMVMEYAGGGELFEHVMRQNKLPEIEARRLFMQLLDGLSYSHSKRVIHRDLKAENVFLDEKLETIKIGDWGFSAVYKPNATIETACGSLDYAAPEILSGKPHVGPEVDVWALGVLLYFMVCGWLPFRAATEFDVYQKIKKGDYRALPSNISSHLKDLIKQMFTVDPKARPTISQTQQHEWCTKPLSPTVAECNTTGHAIVTRSRSDPLLAAKDENNPASTDLVQQTSTHPSPSPTPSPSKKNTESGNGRKMARPFKRSGGSKEGSPGSSPSTSSPSSPKATTKDPSKRKGAHHKHAKRKERGERGERSGRKDESGRPRQKQRRWEIKEEEEEEDDRSRPAPPDMEEEEDLVQLTKNDIKKVEITEPPANLSAPNPPKKLVEPIIVPAGAMKLKQPLPPEPDALPFPKTIVDEEDATESKFGAEGRQGRRPSVTGNAIRPKGISRPLERHTPTPVLTRSTSDATARDLATTAVSPRSRPTSGSGLPGTRQNREKRASAGESRKRARGSVRNSVNYSILRVDGPRLEELKAAKDVEILNIDEGDGEPGQHVVLVAARAERGNERTVIGDLRQFEQRSAESVTRNARSKSVSVQLQVPSVKERRRPKSIFVQHPEKVLEQENQGNRQESQRGWVSGVEHQSPEHVPSGLPKLARHKKLPVAPQVVTGNTPLDGQSPNSPKPLPQVPVPKVQLKQAQPRPRLQPVPPTSSTTTTTNAAPGTPTPTSANRTSSSPEHSRQSSGDLSEQSESQSTKKVPQEPSSKGLKQLSARGRDPLPKQLQLLGSEQNANRTVHVLPTVSSPSSSSTTTPSATPPREESPKPPIRASRNNSLSKLDTPDTTDAAADAASSSTGHRRPRKFQLLNAQQQQTLQLQLTTGNGALAGHLSPREDEIPSNSNF